MNDKQDEILIGADVTEALDKQDEEAKTKIKGILTQRYGLSTIHGKVARHILEELKELGYGRPDPTKCPYCDKKPDGPMLQMGSSIAHAHCVIRVLNELLDPDWEKGKEPAVLVGWLR